MDSQALNRAGEDEMREVLASPSLRGEALRSAIAMLGARRGIEPFRACLWLLARIDRSEDEARDLLDAVETQRSLLQERLGRDPGLAVAALDSILSPDGALRLASRRPGPSAETGMTEAGEDPERAPIEDLLECEVRRAARHHEPLALVVLGPERGGDEESVMSLAASALSHGLRDTDHAARVLPAGYVVVLPSTSGASALEAAGRMRERLLQATGVAWSAGVAAAPDLPLTSESLAAGAVGALREARLSGGGRVVPRRLERRAHPRRSAGDHVRAMLRWGGLDQETTLADLSVGGALLETALPLVSGTEVLLELRETCARPREARIQSRVVRVDRTPPGSGDATFRTAVSFLAGSRGMMTVAGLLTDLPVPAPRGPERA